MRYERETKSVDESGGFDVQGRVVDVLDAPRGGRSRVTVLVERVSEEPTATATPGHDPEGVDLYESGNPEPVDTTEKTAWFCGEPKSDDEPCEREVDGPDETCWQHGDE